MSVGALSTRRHSKNGLLKKLSDLRKQPTRKYRQPGPRTAFKASSAGRGSHPHPGLDFFTGFAIADVIMSKPIEHMIIQSILDDFAASHQSREELEAKALFRLLNFCLPPDLEFEARPFAPNSPNARD